MASISGASSSNMTSSLYNSANIISGLASGLDTEGMIESLVKSYQTKINQLNQKVTKTEWKQDAYRSIISKMVGFSSKYTSYSSSTNLMSPSFFNNAVKVATQGIYADKVSASGKTSSDIALNAVHQLATSAQFRTQGNMNVGDGKSITASEGIDLKGKTTLGSLSGSLTLTYGSNTISLSFDEVADKEALDEIKKNGGSNMSETEALAQLINQKLEGQKISFSGGTSADAKDRIEVRVDGNSITFRDKSSAGNAVYLSKASGNVGDVLGLDLTNASENKPNTIKTNYDFSTTKQVENAKYLSEKTMNLSLDGGTAKQIKLPKITGSSGNYKIVDADGKALDYTAENYTKVLNDALSKAYKGKVTAENVGTDGKLQLKLNVQEGSDLLINTDVGEALGIGRSATSYLNTSKTLGDLLGEDKLNGLTAAKDADGKDMVDAKGNKLYDFKINGVKVGQYTKDTKLSEIMNDINSNKEAGVKVSYSQTTKEFLFSAKETGADSEIKIEGGLAEAIFGSTEPEDLSSANFADTYGISAWLRDGDKIKFTVPGAEEYEVEVSKADTVQDVIDRMNKTPMGSDAEFSYNKYTGQIEAKDKKSGKALELEITNSYGHKIEVDKSKVPNIDYTPGQDSKFSVTINGKTMEMSRSSNTVSIDGLSITMNDTFDGSVDKDGKPSVSSSGKPNNPVTFKTSTDSDKIVDAIKTMIEDYNTMMAEIKSAYSTMPYQKSNGSFANYEPLTDEDREGMTESAIERYEEKAKQGILFGDRTLSRLYDKMRNIFSPSGEDGAYLRAMGISSSFSISDGTQTVTLDEDKLRAMLDSEPEIVADVFTRTGGSNNGGVMQNLKTQLDAYAKTTGEPKGILIQQAGSPLSSLSLMNNTWQSQIDSLNTQIEKWQDKLSDQVDRYTSQFSRLEQLINQMNSQSSALAGLMGG